MSGLVKTAKATATIKRLMKERLRRLFLTDCAFTIRIVRNTPLFDDWRRHQPLDEISFLLLMKHVTFVLLSTSAAPGNFGTFFRLKIIFYESDHFFADVAAIVCLRPATGFYQIRVARRMAHGCRHRAALLQHALELYRLR